MAIAGSLFTCFFLATASSQDMYYRSFERSYRGDPDAVDTVRIGLGEAEIFEPQVGSIELAGGSKGGLVWVCGDSHLMPLEMTYEGSSHRQGPSS